MGNSPYKLSKISKKPLRRSRSRSFSKFNGEELIFLEKMFEDLAQRSVDASKMSKETFLEYFNLPGIIGGKLFKVFDTKKNNVIEYDEFVEGIARYMKGDTIERSSMLFELFDLDKQNYVTKKELSIVLLSLIDPDSVAQQQQQLHHSNNVCIYTLYAITVETYAV